MKVLLLSDIHGNLPALETVLRVEQNWDQIISLGDVVNYGPWSNECVDLLESIKAITLKGNHEEYFIMGKFPDKNALVKQFFDFCFPRFERIEVIKEYRPKFDIGGFTCVHTIDDEYIYPDTAVDFQSNYFIGHSHVQFIREQAGWKLVNVGSVGQNRQNLQMLNYAIFESNTGEVALKGLPHDNRPCVEEMKKLNYPVECINYYERKLATSRL